MRDERTLRPQAHQTTKTLEAHPQERGVAAAAAAAHGHAARRRAAAAAAARAVGRFAAVGLAAVGGIALLSPRVTVGGSPLSITILFLFIRLGIVSEATREELAFVVVVGVLFHHRRRQRQVVVRVVVGWRPRVVFRVGFNRRTPHRRPVRREVLVGVAV